MADGKKVQVQPFFSGLDLGQSRDPTVLAVLEQSLFIPEEIVLGEEGGEEKIEAPDENAQVLHIKSRKQYSVRYLKRFQLGTSYTDIADEVKKAFAVQPLRNTTLAVDMTGVGRPVVDILRKLKPACRLRTVTITSGGKWTVQDGGFNVPKKDIAGILQVFLEQRRLKVAPALPEADVLVRELRNFKVKVTAAANYTFEAWRESANDDIVLAVGIALWVAEKGSQKLRLAC